MNREIYKEKKPIKQGDDLESLEYKSESKGKPVNQEQTMIDKVKGKFKKTPEEKTPEEKRRDKIGRDKIIHNVEHRVLKELGKERKGFVGKSLNWLNEKYGEDWLERRGIFIAEKSGINKAIEDIKKQEIIIADIGSGKSGINEAIIKNNPDNDIKIIGFDESDRATEKVSKSSERNIGSAYAIGEKLPIEDKRADVVKFDFTFQEADDEMMDKLLKEAKRILKDDGIITVIDDLPQEKFIDEQFAKIKNKSENRRPGKLNLHSKDEWGKFFKDNGLEIENSTVFGDEEESKKEQFISFVLKKAEEKVEE